MAEKKLSNTVKIVGYLKENNLAKITNSKGINVINGSLTIAVDDINTHKVQFYVAETTKSGETSKDYEALSELLPDCTITVASFLKENPTADFKTAANAASKVWVMARLEEFASRTGERERSLVQIKGFRAGFKTATDKGPFVPCAEFTVDVYINDITAEDGNTGRLVLEGLIPMYDKSVQKISFVAPTTDGIADYIGKNYRVGDTVTLKGDLISIQERIEVAGNSGFFGRGNGPQYETKFIRERRIYGGSEVPLHQGDEGAISTSTIKEGLAQREIKMDANGAKAAARDAAKESTAPKAAPKATASNFSEDVDF